MSARQGKRLRRRFSPPKARIFTRAPVRGSEWELDQLDGVGADFDHRSFDVPGAQHRAMGFAVAQRQPVHRRAMGMAVDHPAHVVAQHRLFDCLRVDVHDGFRLVLVGLLAAARMLAAIFSRQRSAAPGTILNQRVVHFTAELLIGLIVGAQGVAVQDQDPAAVQLQHFSPGSSCRWRGRSACRAENRGCRG